MGGSIVSGMSQRVTIGVRSFKNLELRTSNLEPPSVALFPPVSPVALELGIGDRSKLGLEQVGGVLIFQLLAQFDQLLFECQEPVTDGVRQVAVVHGRIG